MINFLGLYAKSQSSIPEGSCITTIQNIHGSNGTKVITDVEADIPEAEKCSINGKNCTVVT